MRPTFADTTFQKGASVPNFMKSRETG